MYITIDFKPGVSTSFNIDDGNILFHVTPPRKESVADQDELVLNSLNNPIATKKLENLLKPEMQVAILVDDITRPTPTARILPFLMQRLQKARIPNTNIKIIIAPGTHRPMTDEELEFKLSSDIIKKFIVLNRDYREKGKFKYLGKTSSGIPIDVYCEVYDADFVIGLGNVTPHISAGWSGGSKIILPGVCSSRTTDMMHYAACVVQPVLDILGTNNNVPRKEMDEIAQKVGLNFIVNTVLDKDKNIQAIFSGHFIEAHRSATEFAQKDMIYPIPSRADILIVSANPCYFDYWQGIKPYAYSHRAVRDGGVIIFLLDGEEHLCGDAPSHESTLRKYMHWDFKDMVKEVESCKATDIVGMNVPMYHATLRHRVTTFLVTKHLTDEEVDILGFKRMISVQEALSESLKLLGSNAKVGIIPYGGETLTRVDSKAFHQMNNSEEK